MKALSVKQPWANLIAKKLKTIEIRTWQTDYRGDLVICSSQYPTVHPFGCAICIVELFKIEPMKKEHALYAKVKFKKNVYAWHFRNVRLLSSPISIKGNIGLFDIDQKVLLL